MVYCRRPIARFFFLMLLVSPGLARPGEACHEEALWELATAPLAEGRISQFFDGKIGKPVEKTAYPFEGEGAAGHEIVAFFLRGTGWNGFACERDGVITLQRLFIDRPLTGLTLPVALGQTVEEVEAIIGKGVPVQDSLMYNALGGGIPFHRVRLLLRNHRVVAIEWIFEPSRTFCPHLDKLNGRIREPGDRLPADSGPLTPPA